MLVANEQRHKMKVYALEHGPDEIFKGRIKSDAQIVNG